MSAPSLPPKKLVIATRESRLALWQAQHVQARLRALYPDCAVELLGMTTRGDQILDRSLSKVGGKGLFVKELELALLEGRADLAVHSLKDVPMQLEADFALPVIMERADPRDAFVSPNYADLASLPAGAVVGTSSLRRAAQLRAHFPQLVIEPLRGNLDTRVGKVDRGEYAAIILAAAGLKRLGLAERIRALLPTTSSLPAPGQGALGLETLAARADVQAWLAPLHHAVTAACVSAERTVARALGGSCQVPLAAYAEAQGDELHLRALVASVDGTRILEAEARGPQQAASALGDQVSQQLRAAGAEALLAEILADTLANPES